MDESDSDDARLTIKIKAWLAPVDDEFRLDERAELDELDDGFRLDEPDGLDDGFRLDEPDLDIPDERVAEFDENDSGDEVKFNEDEFELT